MKIGDKVICISGCSGQHGPQTGDTYTIEQISHDDIVHLKEMPEQGWFLERFELHQRVGFIIE